MPESKSSGSTKRSRPLTKAEIDGIAASGPYGPMVFPPFGMTMSRGFAAVGTSLGLLAFTLLSVAAYWLVMVAFGLRSFPPQMGSALSLPPVGSFFDLSAGDSLFGLTNLTGFGLVLGLTILRSLFVAISTGLIDEALDFRRISVVGLIRGLRAFGAVLFFSYVNLGLVLIGYMVISPMLGAGLGQIVRQVTLIGGLFAFSFAPAAAVRLEVPAREAAARSVRAARLPGWPRHLLMVVIYYFLAVYVLALVVPSVGTTVNPTARMWIFAMLGNFLEMAFVAGLVFRWKAVESFVPAQTARRTGSPSRRRC